MVYLCLKPIALGFFGISLSTPWGKLRDENTYLRNALTATQMAMVDMANPGYSSAGVAVSQAAALSIPAVWGAIDTISKVLASLPFDLYERTDTGAVVASNHPNYYITKHEPSPYMTGFNFRRALFAQACFGDAYARIYRNGIGRPTRLELLQRTNVEVQRTTTGDLVYRVYYPGGLAGGGAMRTEILYPWEIIHIKGLTLDGILGEDLCKTHKDTFGMAIAANQTGASFYGNGAQIGGVLHGAEGMTPDQLNSLQNRWNSKYAGATKAGKTVVLDAGIKYEKVGLNPAESSLNETRTFQRRETATILGIPLHLLQDLGDTTFNNVETMSVQFVTLCLRPWAVQTEQEFFVKTLTSEEKRTAKYFYRLNLNGLLRGDTKTRADLYRSGIESGWLLRNEARALEDLNEVEGLDRPTFPANMQILGTDGLPEINDTNEMAQPKADQSDTGDQNNNDDGQPAAGK